MASVKNPCKRQPTVLPHHPTPIRLISIHVLVPSAPKPLTTRPIRLQRQTLNPEPRTAVIAIAVHQSNIDAAVEEVLDILHASGSNRVAGDAEDAVVDEDGVGSEVDWDAQCALDPGLVEEDSGVRGREGVWVEVSHVESAALLRICEFGCVGPSEECW